MTEGKKYTAAAAKIDRTKLYDVQQAVALVRSAAYAKFNETLEVALRLGVRSDVWDGFSDGMFATDRDGVTLVVQNLRAWTVDILG